MQETLKTTRTSRLVGRNEGCCTFLIEVDVTTPTGVCLMDTFGEEDSLKAGRATERT